MSRRYTRHGLNALKTRVEVRGLKALDRRTAVAKALIEWRKGLIADLGGDTNLSTAERTLVESATRNKLFLDHIDAHLMEQETLVHKRKGIVMLLRDRQRVADSLQKTLMALGLKRRKSEGRTQLEVIRG